MVDLADQKRVGRKFGMTVSDCLMKDKLGKWVIPVLAAVRFTEGTIADKLKGVNFLPDEPSNCRRIILSLDNVPIGGKKDLAKIVESNTSDDVGMWFGPKFKIKLGENLKFVV